MNYDEFKNELQEEIQSNFLQHIDFISDTVTKTNMTLDALTMRFEGQDIACTIYPEQMYDDYKNGVSISNIANGVSMSVSEHLDRRPEMPELTPENAKNSISFSLINIEKNKEMLKNCPYKELHDMAAVPRWHMSDASFLVNNSLIQQLRMTKEEILEIAQRNTESAEYSCTGMDDIMREIAAEQGISEEFLDELFPTPEPPFHLITNKNRYDGSCAMLSDSFMQRAAEQMGCDEIYLLPASRHEIITVNPDVVTDTTELKDLVMSVNGNSNLVRTEDFLSDSIYKYNAKSHSISVCDNNGLFHDKTVGKDTEKQSINKGRGRA